MIFACPLAAAEPANLAVELPCQADRGDPITHEVDFSAVVTPPYHCKVLRVWLPLPPSDRTQEVTGSVFSTFPERVEMQVRQEPVYGNRFAYFEFHNPRGAQIIRHRFTAKVWSLDWNLDPQKINSVDDWPKEFDPYLQPHAVVSDHDFAAALREIVPPAGSPTLSLFRAMQWIDAHLTYDHVNASLQADPVHAFTRRRGHCSDYHGLCEAMGRALGYPTRVAYGLSLFPKNSPSHCKLEAFLPPYGWVSFDLSETQKLVAAIQQDKGLGDAEKEQLIAAARSRLHEGFRENSWLLVTRGTDYELAPKASRPVRVVRTIYAEADGEPLPEPDPANPNQREFAWMTVHKYDADKPFKLPFQDYSTLIRDAE
ncbi:MAG: transglutaminase domain-containing protein [Planctomycetes bacterium]|nr:transglutaminase domain-containing protein [Planctomycetota bacterium]